MQLQGHDKVAAHCSYAVLILRLAGPRAGKEREALRARLVEEGVIDAAPEAEERPEEDAPEEAEKADEESGYLTGVWRPRTPEATAAAATVLQALEAAEAGWVLSANTFVDLHEEEEEEGEDDEDEKEEGEDDEDEEEEGEDDEDAWQHGPPPAAETAPFPLDGYPSILRELDWEDFGIAIKLAAPPVAGTLEVIDRFHQVWLMHYADPRVRGFPFRNHGALLDEDHQSALLWVDRFAAPGSDRQKVHHLIAVVNALHAVVPIAHARFGGATTEQKYHGTGLVLAGNPLGAAYSEGGEEASFAWSEAASDGLWSTVERAAMFVDLGMGFAPDVPEEAEVAVRMFDRAVALDPDNADAWAYGVYALACSGRIDETLSRAEGTPVAAKRLYAFSTIAEEDPGRVPDAFSLLDEATIRGAAEDIDDLVIAVAAHCPDMLPKLLARVPEDEEFITPLHAAASRVDEPLLKLAVLQRIIALPVPEDGHQRENYIRAHNNACIVAHAREDYVLARALADGAQPFTLENPYIFHSAACAYAAAGDLDAAMSQVEGAIATAYDHLEKLEVDTDLGELLVRPDFVAAFAAWRERDSQSEPVHEVGTDDFEELVLQCDRPVLVDFAADWCQPCKVQAPILEKLARLSGGDYRIVTLDIDASPEIAERYQIQSVPTLAVFSKGEVRAQTSGVTGLPELRRLLADG